MKEIIFEDDFANGLEVGTIAEQRKWNFMQVGPMIIMPEGIVIESGDGIRVVPDKIDDRSGKPAFSVTAPGQGDHMKWSVNVNVETPDGTHGVEILPGKTYHFEAVLGGTQYGMKQHPFGDSVSNAEDDARLGVPILMIFDPITMNIFDFALTNEKVYAIYERGKGMSGQSGHAAYSFEIPLADRKPFDNHLLRISYNCDCNTVAWHIDDKEVFSVSSVGCRIDRKYMYIDNGGEEEESASRVLNCGLGLLTLLDGAKDGEKALVNLTAGMEGTTYYDPKFGAPELVEFVDPENKQESRLFGQGAELRCSRFGIYTTED